MTSTAPTYVNNDPALIIDEETFSRINSATTTPASNSQARVNGE